MTETVVLDNVSKVYGRRQALAGVNLAVDRGTIYGLIGPNGAGKTTTLSILAGLVLPTSGTASILGMRVEPNRRELASSVGFASPQFSYFDYLSGAEVILACALMHGLAPREAEARMRELVALFELREAAGHYLYAYSQGMRHKLGLACALVHGPGVLLLDEPFAGLDPTSVYRLTWTLRKLAVGGRTVVLTSHDLALVERLCDRIGILHEGSLKHETARAAESAEGRVAAGDSSLEQLLWKVVGTPEFKELSWI